MILIWILISALGRPHAAYSVETKPRDWPARDRVCRIMGVGPDGGKTLRGSGVLIDARTVVTARHVIETVGNSNQLGITRGTRSLWIEVDDLKPTGPRQPDATVIRLPAAFDESLVNLEIPELAAWDDLRRSARLCVLGYGRDYLRHAGCPAGFGPTGVDVQRHYSEDKMFYVNHPWNCVVPGDSGGALVGTDAAGRNYLLGIMAAKATTLLSLTSNGFFFGPEDIPRSGRPLVDRLRRITLPYCKRRFELPAVMVTPIHEALAASKLDFSQCVHSLTNAIESRSRL